MKLIKTFLSQWMRWLMCATGAMHAQSTIISFLFLSWLVFVNAIQASPVVLNTNLQIRLILNTPTSSESVRIAKDPRNNQLYYLKINGDIYQVNLTNSTSAMVYSSTDHGLSGGVEGLAIGPDGAMYVLGNFSTADGNYGYIRIMKGVPNNSGIRVWSLLAQTDLWPRSKGPFDHNCSALIVSPDGQYLYCNAGSRTDHGEVQDVGGLFPNKRDVALTAKIFRLPANGSNLFLTNDLTTLMNAGYVFAQGTRNAFDFAFAPNGDLLATDNGPDRDMSESLYWLREGLHYGFPWRMGGMDNPQQFSNYNPTNDLLLDTRYTAVQSGYYHNDPTFPPPPTNFADPVINLGPDADEYRDPNDGLIKNSSQLGRTLATFTAHRSPLGLVFDDTGAMAPPFQYHGFVLSWTPGDPNGNSVAGPFDDPGQDMLDLNMTKLGNTNYEMQVTRIVGGFSNPIDAEIINNKIYVIEYGGNQGLWEITFPVASQSPAQSTSFSAQQPYILSLDSTLTNIFYFPNPIRTYSTNVTLTAATSLTINFSPPFVDANYIVTAPNALVGSMVTARTTTNFTLGFTSATLNSQTIEGSCIHQWNYAPVAVMTNPVVPVATNTLTGNPAITSSPVVMSSRNDFTGLVGWTSKTSTSMHITQIGRWVQAGNSATHTLYVYSGPLSSPALLGSVVINASGAPANQFLYATLATPISVSSGTVITVLSSEASGGDEWYSFEGYTWTGDFVPGTTSSAYSTDGGATINTPSLNQSFVPVNIIYSVP